MFNWLKRKKWLVVNAILVGVLVSMLGVQIVDRSDAVDRSVKIGLGSEKVITLGSVAYAAGSVDYTYDGVDDNIQFQAALDALPATGGRLVDVSAVQKNFSATVTRAIANVVIEGSGFGSYFTNNGVTAIFTAGGNGWSFNALRTDAGGIAMGATTGWQWVNVNDGSGMVYDFRTPASSIVNNTYSATTFDATTTVSIGDIDLTDSGADDRLLVGTYAIPRAATYVIAASNAPASVKAQADYVVVGTAEDEIQAAFNAAPAAGANFIFPQGTYSLTPTAEAPILSIGKPFTLQGAGRGLTTWQVAASAVRNTYFLIAGVSSDGSLIRDITFDGNLDNQPAYVDDAHQRGFELHGDNTTVENCSINNFHTISLNLNAPYCKAIDNIVDRGRICINGSHVEVLNNVIRDNARAGAIECFAGSANEDYEGVIIEGNYIVGSLSKGIEYYATNGSLTYGIVRGNIVEDCSVDRGLYVYVGGSGNITRNLFEGNIFSGTTVLFGGLVHHNEFSHNTLQGGYLLLSDVYEMTITSNRFYNGGWWGMSGEAVWRSLITDNYFYDCVTGGIQIRSMADYYSTHNRVINNHSISSDNTNFTNGCVYVSTLGAGHQTENIVIGNTLHRGAASKALNFATADDSTVYSEQHAELFMDVVAPVAGDVKGYTAATATTYTVLTQPDVPRTVRFVLQNNTGATDNGTAMNVTFNGLSARGITVSEVLSYTAAELLNLPHGDSVSKSTNYAFALLTNVILSDSQPANWRFQIERGNKTGLCNDITSSVDVYKVKENTTNLNVPAIDVAYDTITLPVDTGDDFTVWYKVDTNIKTE